LEKLLYWFLYDRAPPFVWVVQPVHANFIRLLRNFDIGGKVKNAVHSELELASSQAGKLTSPPVSSAHRLLWSCGVVQLERMTFQN